MFLGFFRIPLDSCKPSELTYVNETAIHAFEPADNGKGCRIVQGPEMPDLITDLSLRDLEKRIRAARCDGRVFLTCVREVEANPDQMPLPLSPPVDDKGRSN